MTEMATLPTTTGDEAGSMLVTVGRLSAAMRAMERVAVMAMAGPVVSTVRREMRPMRAPEMRELTKEGASVER